MKLELFYPVKPAIISQRFGDTALLSYYKENGIIFTGHNGVDMAAIHGQEVYAAHEGTVDVQVDSKSGHGVVVASTQLYEYKDGEANFRSIYWHLIDNIPVKTGQKVKAGDLLGYADSTGVSTGSHLHFGLKPARYGVNTEQNNGYQGAIDPEPYFNKKFAQDLNGMNFIFTRDLEQGQTSEDVRQLQRKLQRMGYFPMTQPPTAYYGTVTRNAVYAFQMDYIPNLTWAEKYIYMGKYCGRKTRAVLNNL